MLELLTCLDSHSEGQGMLGESAVSADPRGRKPSGWYRCSPGLTGIVIGRNYANCGWVWKPKGPFISLKAKEHVEPRREAV